jgi:hypothetical protein
LTPQRVRKLIAPYPMLDNIPHQSVHMTSNGDMSSMIIPSYP